MPIQPLARPFPTSRPAVSAPGLDTAGRMQAARDALAARQEFEGIA